MGGLGPGIGGFEILMIGIVALLVVGPKDLPLLMRKIGRVMAKARTMANEFRSSFDEMARQSELDELRKEVEALRTGQGMHPLGAEADAAFRDIRDDLNKPLEGPAAPPMLTGPEEWPDSAPVMAPRDPVVAEPAAEIVKTKARARPKSKAPGASIKTASGKSRPIRAKKVDL
ncbi:MAG: Sec-independent protein translocase protein TatB [Brevundimonas sp.]|uniref:Sec-independent protein translocase protein TatB n=1 Tax=Brevundimonas sp. TaxID=1871086 RepID=UPI0027245053|nr:Sec-independent protein translocase protein TatB [Brevundimonas sp.]MDO9588221.1 Sec-independent protein translocase protein TatB [Brevundimonas sp.]